MFKQPWTLTWDTMVLWLVNVASYFCRFNKSWLTKGYSSKEVLDKQSKFFSKELKAALYGIHERDRSVVTEPSKVDLDFLSAMYSKQLY